jgi:hypothetical protein
MPTPQMSSQRHVNPTIPSEATCDTCRWYHPTPMHADECRRHAPVVMTTGILPKTVWPETSEDDWCREWEGRAEGAHD